MSVSKQLMKWKLEDEKRVGQDGLFCFIEHKGNIICLICKAKITIKIITYNDIF